MINILFTHEKINTAYESYVKIQYIDAAVDVTPTTTSLLCYRHNYYIIILYAWGSVVKFVFTQFGLQV